MNLLSPFSFIENIVFCDIQKLWSFRKITLMSILVSLALRAPMYHTISLLTTASTSIGWKSLPLGCLVLHCIRDGSKCNPFTGVLILFSTVPHPSYPKCLYFFITILSLLDILIPSYLFFFLFWVSAY